MSWAPTSTLKEIINEVMSLVEWCRVEHKLDKKDALQVIIHAQRLYELEKIPEAIEALQREIPSNALYKIADKLDDLEVNCGSYELALIAQAIASLKKD